MHKALALPAVLSLTLAACSPSARAAGDRATAAQTTDVVVRNHPVSSPVPVIYDTDISTDVDDVGALAMLHGMADQGEVKLLAVMVSSTDEYAASAADAVNTFYGRPDLPIGALQEFHDKATAPAWTMSRYTKELTEEFPNDLRSGRTAPDATRLYREILVAQPDHSVTLIAVGFATNIRHLLESGPDDISPLSGPELLARKVRMYAAGGNGSATLPDGKPGFNYRMDLESARYEVEHFPKSVPMVYAGGAVWGDASVLTGPRLRTETPEGHIVRRGYELWFRMRADPSDWRRGNWDQLRVLYGVRGLGRNFESSGPGNLSVILGEDPDGRIRWEPDPRGHVYWLRLARPAEEVAREIEDLMIWPGSPGRASGAKRNRR